jgi:hypothetical protein
MTAAVKRLSHFRKSEFAVLYRGSLVVPPNGSHHQLYVGYGAGCPLVRRKSVGRLTRGIQFIALIARPGHLVDFIKTIAAGLNLFVPPGLIYILQ